MIRSSAVPKPQRGIDFNWALVIASCWFVCGLLLDGWAHTHLDLRGEGVFTPFHAVLYTGFLAVAAVTAVTLLRRRRRAGSWRRAVPEGHGATVAGIAVFTIGGALDLTWHGIFGIEQDVQAVLSPTHLLLALGVALILLGPFRAVRARAGARGWRAYAPAIVAFTLFLTLVEFFTQWAVWLRVDASMNPSRIFHLLPRDVSDVQYVQLTHDLLATVFIGAMLSGTAIFLTRRLPVPFGAITAIFGFAGTMLAFTLGAPREMMLQLVLSSLGAGVAADALRTLRGLQCKPQTRIIAIGAAVPLTYWGTYFAIVAASGGSWWQVHSLVGAPFLSVVAGVMLALFQQAPRDAAAVVETQPSVRRAA